MHRTVHHIICSKTLYWDIHPRTITSKLHKKVEESFNLLDIPVNSSQEIVKKAFLELAKKYHPDSSSPDADIDKFVAIENAFRILSKYNTGSSNSDEIEQIVFDIRHTAPQHRQYLSFEGVGYGTPSQRQKQWAQTRAQRAANNVMEHRVAKAVASENTLMKKDSVKKHDIKTKYGFDRLVEDLIQEAMSKEEFENLSGKGKPLKNQNSNHYVDFTTHKLNEVLINNGFTPEWITMSKEIDEDIDHLKEEIKKDRLYLGPHPLNEIDVLKWNKICASNRLLAQSINVKINTFNLIVPLLNKQKFHVDFDKISENILIEGDHSKVKEPINSKIAPAMEVRENDDIIATFFKALTELLSFGKDKRM